VLRILDAAGLSRSDLRNVPDLPLGVVERQRAVSEGEAPTRLAQNCSGKHAAMLATCVVNGWSTENYLAPSHPLTATLRRSVATQTGDVVSATSIDGCGAEVQAVTLAGMARAFSRLVTAPQGSAERAVADAMRGHPELVGGEGRDVTALMRSVPGALAKDGAEGVQVIALADGGSVAAKAADGADRARMPCAAPGLIALGVAEASLAGIDRIPALGGGIEVGELRGLR
jgi:L-asparaginase II